jgi:WD40 repeat protein
MLTILLSMVACTHTPENPPTFTQQQVAVTSMPGPTETVTHTAIPSPIPTLTPRSNVTPLSNVLTPGLYLGSVPECVAPILSPPVTQFCNVWAVSTNDNTAKMIARIAYNGIGIGYSVFHGKWLAFEVGQMDEHGNGLPNVIIVLDIETGKSFEVSAPKGEFCQLEDISPDETQIVVTCHKDNDYTEIGLLSIADGNLITLLDHKGETYVKLDYRGPRWSPDGKWLFFYKVNIYAGGQDVENLYVTDMSCVSEPSACQGSTKQLSLSRPEGEEYSHTIASWTADSHLAWVLYDRIEVYDVESEQRIHSYQGDPGEGRIEQIAWSPDGRWIAIIQDNASWTLLISLQGDERIHLPHKVANPFWISVP